MRYIKKPKIEHSQGEVRIKHGFLIFPKELMNTCGLYEIRWLEKTEWQQIYAGKAIAGYDVWLDTRW